MGYQPRASGSSTPGLPVWTYTAGAIGAGLFKPNNASVATTTSIQFSFTNKSGGDFEDVLTTFGDVKSSAQSTIILTDSSGNSVSFSLFLVSAIGASSITFTVAHIGGSGSWSGDYQFSSWDRPVTLPNILASASVTPFADGAYTVGIGGTQNGSISIVSGVITNIIEAQA